MADIQEDEPLDPKVEAIRKKMVRLLMVSGGIMMLGLMTVLIAIVYKLNEDSAVPVAATGEIVMPAGTTIMQSSVGEDRMLFVVQDASGQRQVLTYDYSGRQIAAYTIREE
ncbi:MAG: DUF6476 family protein [Pseudomonadota bacterium]